LRRRLGLVVVFVVILAVASPSLGTTSRTRVGCAGHVRSGHAQRCTRTFSIPHFNARDSFDLDRLVARIISADAASWRVTGKIYDARGVLYFTWYCSAGRSSVTPAAGTYSGHSCAASRRTVRVRRNGRTTTDYYVADTSRPQRLVTTASVGSCAPVSPGGCRFEGRAVYRLSS
jgi:hypothetical protein